MNCKHAQFATDCGKKAGRLAVAALIAAGAVAPLAAQSSIIRGNGEKQTVTTQNRFYCNIKALTTAERAHHTELTAKLVAVRREMVEMEKGYEFQFRPEDVSLAELADWVAAESKCCPFFDFHIDLENRGTLLCLRLTGEKGIKSFVRAEFEVGERK